MKSLDVAGYRPEAICQQRSRRPFKYHRRFNRDPCPPSEIQSRSTWPISPPLTSPGPPPSPLPISSALPLTRSLTRTPQSSSTPSRKNGTKRSMPRLTSSSTAWSISSASLPHVFFHPPSLSSTGADAGPRSLTRTSSGSLRRLSRLSRAQSPWHAPSFPSA